MKIKKIDLINTFAQSVGLETATRLITDKIQAAALKNKIDYTGEEIARICGELAKEGGLVRIVAQSFLVQSKRREAEEQTLLLDNIETQIWYLTDFETCGTVNKARADFFGVDKKDFDGKKLYDIINKEEAEVCIAGNREVFEKKEQIHTEQYVTNSKGEMCILSIIKIPKLSKNIDVEYVICTAEDITKQKQAEEALQNSEEKFRLLAENSIDCIWMLNTKLRFTYVSPSVETILGFKPEQLVGTKLSSHFKKKEFLKVGILAAKGIKNYKTSPHAILETKILNSKNDEVNVEISGKVLLNSQDKLIGLQGTTRDITDRKQAEKMEAAYTDILTISNKTLDLHTIVTEGLDSLMKYTDAQAGAVYLYDPDSKMMVPNVTAGMEKTVAGQDFSPGEGFVGEVTQKQEMIVVTSIPADTIYTIKSGSKHIIPATIISTPIIFKGTLLGVVVTYHNTSIPPDVLIFIKRVIDQYAVALNNANTLIQVQEMAATLKNQRDEIEIRSHELEAASRTKSEFLANMSHELRTPLNSIIGFSEILHDGTFGTLNEKQTRYISNVLISGKHLLELINGILDLAKVESGKMELICEDFNVSEVIDESMILLSSIASKKNIVLSTAIDKELNIVHADVGKFKQILYNLMSNAIKFTPKGGSVTVEAHRSGDMTHIAVSDTGIGISKEDQDTLFQPFVQIDSSTSREYQGTGLGLSLVKQFVGLHGGRVWIESEPDRGSTFTFTIPI